MKKWFCVFLVLTLCICALSACDRRSSTEDIDAQQGAEFAPETTAVEGLVQAAQTQSEMDSIQSDPALTAEPTVEAQGDTEYEQPIAQDSAVQTQSPADAATEEPASANNAVVQPFASPTPQPNTTITSYSEVTGSGLGFKFSYPSDWINIPGYSTVCYIQPTENGTVYPARVSVTMKRLPHKCSEGEDQQELASFLKNLMTQYDEKTFKVDMNLDTSTKFMNNQAISTTYLAYDGDQEIQGYVILTYFERYLFCFHFLCAYEDYAAFEPAMRHMRDSVQADQSQVAPQ